MAKFDNTIEVAIVLVERCLGSAVIGAVDLLLAANRASQHLDPERPPLFRWRLTSEDGRPVTTGNGYPQAVDCDWNSLGRVDLVYLAGIAEIDEALFLPILQRNQALQSWLRLKAAQNVVLASSCTGSFFFAEAGLLQGRKATTAWSVSALFARRYPEVDLQPDALLVQDGSVLCAGAATSYQDLLLALIRRFGGRRIASLVSRYMLVEYQRESQAPFRMSTELHYDDPLIVAAAEQVRTRLKEPLSVDTLAEHLHVSNRTLIRRFRKATGESPLAFIQQQRIESAKRLLELTALPLEEIVQRVGYADISTFRRLFKRITGLTPKVYRQRFGVVPD
ncbi:MAG: helix-turn-helix domain-containing protein [Chromatiales bacterium]|nr:helix-turn-helix domain-containing protein [Chromatiales bacterium]